MRAWADTPIMRAVAERLDLTVQREEGAWRAVAQSLTGHPTGVGETQLEAVLDLLGRIVLRLDGAKHV